MIKKIIILYQLSIPNEANVAPHGTKNATSKSKIKKINATT